MNNDSHGWRDERALGRRLRGSTDVWFLHLFDRSDEQSMRTTQKKYASVAKYCADGSSITDSRTCFWKLAICLCADSVFLVLSCELQASERVATSVINNKLDTCHLERTLARYRRGSDQRKPTAERVMSCGLLAEVLETHSSAGGVASLMSLVLCSVLSAAARPL